MQKLNVNLQNCYGIQKLEHEFNFSDTNSVLIYAPNGLMKSSFANTFACVAKNDKKEKPCDHIYTDRPSKYEILVDNNSIAPESIYVVNPDQEINSEDKISTFLASKQLKDKYDEIHKELNQYKKEFLARLKETSHSSDCEKEILLTFKQTKKDDFFTCLLRIESEIKNEHVFYDFRYNDIFDTKGNVLKFLDKHHDLIQQYFTNYQQLLSQSSFFKNNSEGPSFGTYQAQQLLNSVEDGAFFLAKHKLVLNNSTEIESKDDLESLLKQEIENILNNDVLRTTFSKIDKAIGANTELRAFKTVIEKNQSLIPNLLNYDEFRKNVWYGYLYMLQDQALALLEIYKTKIADLKQLLQDAKQENETWKEILSIYNDRFFVPFEVSIENQEDIILKEETAHLTFTYKDNAGEPMEKPKETILQVLSKGEKRAFFILQFLFEIEARKKEGTESIIILDDIADSFDYKNKYAIIEYLQDLNSDNNFKLIILTHNFDFYRTIASRLHLKGHDVFMAIRKNDGSISLERGAYRKDAFKALSTQASNKLNFISLIPFVRNIIEYTCGNDSDEYTKLTSCLHIKALSSTLTARDIADIYQSHITYCYTIDIHDFEAENIIHLILSTSDDLISQGAINEITLENKLLISIAIRLLTEQFLLHQLGDAIDTNTITSDQTRHLIDSYKHTNPPKEHVSILERVNLMTPENIHVNTFMYEPLIDMSVNHLVKLYNDVKALS